MNLKKIPATVVTGFLGSGKTTLLSSLIRQARGKRIALIVNEFGELDIDAELLRSCPLDCAPSDARPVAPTLSEEGIYELANGCICCTVEEEFLPVMRRLVARRDTVDHILIETSGLALPKPLVQAFNWPEVRQHCTVDAVITVVDGQAVAAGRIADDPLRVQQQRDADANLDHEASLHELLADQLASADLVLINKADQLDAEAVRSVQAVVSRHIRPGVKMLAVSRGEIAGELIMGLECASEQQIQQVHTHHDHHHRDGVAHRHAHDRFNSVVVELGPVDADKVLAIVRQLILRHTIYRVKGFLALPDKPMRQVFQGVGERIEQYFDRLWRADEPRHSRLVFIGQALEQQPLAEALRPAAIAQP